MPAKKEGHTYCINKHTRAIHICCCHHKDTSTHKLFTHVEREMKSVFTKVSALKDSLSLLKSTYKWCTREETEAGAAKEAFCVFVPQCKLCVWIRIEPRGSEIAPFYCTSVYFESVSLAFLHLTWWLHHIPRGTEYISESGRSTGFLSARKQQLVREGLHLTAVLWSYLVLVCQPNKTSTVLCCNRCNKCNYNMDTDYSNDGSCRFFSQCGRSRSCCNLSPQQIY